jgi:hypothetical protein
MWAITIMQPWATLIASGARKYDIRTWGTHRRGAVLIHAGVTYRDLQRELAMSPAFACLLREHAASRLANEFPRGVLLGTADLTDCLLADQVDPAELALGAFRPGRWAWRFDNARLLPSPIPLRRRQGFFEVPQEIVALGAIPL